VRLLLDTNIVIPLLEERTASLPAAVTRDLHAFADSLSVSVASLWEIAIKNRLGKLPLKTPLLHIPDTLAEAGIRLLPISAAHALTEIVPLPDTRDPFDRLLLAQCEVEGMRLVTRDRALAAHPLAWAAG
jgi:PIN domain nuclease of toxin-antitoxin system